MVSDFGGAVGTTGAVVDTAGMVLTGKAGAVIELEAVRIPSGEVGEATLAVIEVAGEEVVEAVPEVGLTSSSMVSSPTSPSSLQQLIVYMPLSSSLTLLNFMLLYFTVNLFVATLPSLVRVCSASSARGGSDVTVKYTVGESPT